MSDSSSDSGSRQDVTRDARRAEVYVVCTGNICRSPFAARALERALRERAGDDATVRVRSAGIHGLVDRPAAEHMRREAQRRGLDLSGHRGQEVQAAALRDADLVVTMTESHRRGVRRLVPEVGPRTFTLKELVRLLEHADAPPADDRPLRELLRETATRAHEQRRRAPASPRPEDVADPYGGTPARYATCADEIEGLVDAFVGLAFGGDEDGRASQALG